jgi:hypothetical protein
MQDVTVRDLASDVGPTRSLKVTRPVAYAT